MEFDRFRKFAQCISTLAGSPIAFVSAFLLVVVWACFGPTAHYSDTWLLVINTLTTLVTFLMVFLIQNTQYRDTRAIHLKLDELIRATSTARNHLIDAQSLPDEELELIHRDLQRLTRDIEGEPPSPER